MVLPEPAAHDALPQAVGWADEIALSLGLSGGGALVLVDRACPARLGDLVRTLRHTWPDVEVHAGVGRLADVAPGSTIVLAPRAEDADWLNQRRQQFAERKLKVVLWCDEATTAALARNAVDFFDWISHRQECPPGPAPFAVHGIRAAFEENWPVVWTGSDRREVVEEVLRAALPGEQRITWLVGSSPYDELVQGMRDAGIVVVHTGSLRQIQRARWARAEARRASRVVLVAPGLDCPGFWPVHDLFEDLPRAEERLAVAGARAPGRIAALLDLEPEAVNLAAMMLEESVDDGDVERAVTEYVDPGAGVSRLANARAITKLPASLFPGATPPVLRGLASRPRVRASFAGWVASAPKNWTNAEPSSFEFSLWTAQCARDAPHDIGAPIPKRFVMRLDLRASSLEPLLPARRAREWMKLAAAAASLGEGTVTSAWIGRIENKIIARAFDEVARGTHDENDPRVLLELLYVGEKKLEVLVTSIARRKRLSIVAAAIIAAAGSIAITLLGARQGIAALPAVTGLVFAYVYYKGKLDSIKQEGISRGMSSFIVLHLLHKNTVRATVEEVDSLLSSEQPEKAEHVARVAARGVLMELGEHHPHYEELVRVLASALIAQQRAGDALQEIEPLLLSHERDASDDLALLAVRLLADVGRPGEAVQVLSWLVQGATPPPPRGAVHASDSQEVVSASDDPLVVRLLARPEGSLRDRPDAHLALVDALLKQGRYPEALLAARDAVSTFAQRDAPAVATLRLRLADLERRLSRPGSSG